MPNISDLQLAAFSKIYGSGLSINDMWIKFLTADGNSRVSSLTDLQTPKVMATPPTLGAAVTATAIVSPQIRAVSTSATGAELDTTFFSTPVGGAWVKAGTSNPLYRYAVTPASTTGYGSSRQTIEFVVDCLAFEIMYGGFATSYRIWVDGELVSATPITVPNDTLAYWKPITFGSRGVRHIVIETDQGMKFGGVTIGPNDTVMPSAVRRPKCLLIGDSFSGATGASVSLLGYAWDLANRLGWDVWTQSQGGSSYTNVGSSSGNFISRIAAHAAIPFDIVMFEGGVTDRYTQSTIQADAEATFALAKTTWPKALVIATSPLINRGVEGWNAFLYMTLLSKVKAAATNQNVMFVNLMEMPFAGNTALSGTFTSTHTGGGATLLSSKAFAVGATIEMSPGLSNAERRIVTACSGAASPYTLTISASWNTHTSGESITQVGNCLWTGVGRVGTTTGVGNCDLYVCSDDLHPSDAGHAAIGSALAHAIAYQLKLASQ